MVRFGSSIIVLTLKKIKNLKLNHFVFNLVASDNITFLSQKFNRSIEILHEQTANCKV
jgi:hypothetical protein